MTANSSLQNLYVDIQGGTEGAKPGDNPVKRVITIRNLGNLKAPIALWVEPTDTRSEPLRRWAVFNKTEDELKLEPDRKIEVELSFSVPPQAAPGFYSYDLRVSSPQYPGEEIRRPQQLQILVTDQESLRTDPKVALTPATNSNQPYRLAIGETLTVEVTVENPSHRTDRFFLTCPDLPDWFTVTYPERLEYDSPIVEQTDGLQLNPKETGQIQLGLHPPPHTPAGNYFPTVRLTSSNRADLVILEIIYLTIPVDDRLLLAMLPASRKIPAKEESFEIKVTNPGNIHRAVAITAADPERKFTYPIQPRTFELPPGTVEHAVLQPRPYQKWRQLWRLKEQTIEFTLDIENLLPPLPTEPLALSPSESNNGTAAIPEPALPKTVPAGTIVWKARRRWLFRLLLIALGLGLFAGTVALLWYFLVWRPSFRPLITEFSTSADAYREGEDRQVKLNWQITNPDRIAVLEIQHNQPEATDPNPASVNASPPAVDAIPLETPGLIDYDPGISPNRNLALNYVSAFAKYADPLFIPEPEAATNTYFFVDSLDPRPPALKPFCTVETIPNSNSIISTLLSWNRRLLNRSPNPQALTCQNVPLAGFRMEEGTYNAELEIYRTQPAGTLSDRAEIEQVAISPPAPPKIQQFTATATAYSLVTPETVATAAAQEATLLDEASPPETLSAITNGDTPDTPEGNAAIASSATAVPMPARTLVNPTNGRPFAPIRLNWEISNFADIQALRLVSLAPDGSENVPAREYDFTQGIPASLQRFCSAINNILICNQVETMATQVGEYVFYLTVIPTRDQGQEEIVKTTPTIPIKPPLPEIVSFALNGEGGQQKPKHVFVLNPARGSVDVTLTWEVNNATQVELMPAPGVIQGNSLTYTVSAAPGSETITLRAVNELEEEVTQSIVIEKVGFDPAQPTSPAANNADAGGVLPPPPTSPPARVPVPTVPIPSTSGPRLPAPEDAPRAN